MTLDISNTDKLNVFRQECARQGISLLPPDVNKSEVEFSVEYDANGKGAIRYALAAVRNVGAAPMAQIVAERDKGGPFKSLFDFAGRVDPSALNKRMLENIAKAGAFDSLEKNRAKVIASLETLIRYSQSKAEERGSNQVHSSAAARRKNGCLNCLRAKSGRRWSNWPRNSRPSVSIFPPIRSTLIRRRSTVWA
jgi:DNA polymerase III, alpha subunit (EC 2.7.7.7)